MVCFHRKPTYKNSSRSTEAGRLVECICKWEENQSVIWGLSHIILLPNVLKGKSLLFIERVFSEGVLDYEMPQLAVHSAAEISFFPYFLSSFSCFIQPYLERPLIKTLQTLCIMYPLKWISLQRHSSVPEQENSKTFLFFQVNHIDLSTLRLPSRPITSAHVAARWTEITCSFSWGQLTEALRPNKTQHI